MWDQNGPPHPHDLFHPTPSPPACIGRERGCIMSDDHVRLLHKALPARLRLCTWTLLYGSRRDGISLQTLYRRAAGRAPTLLVVSDTCGGAFGAFTNEPWKVGPRYRGTGECFVFRLAPEPRIFRWSKLNSFFMLGARTAPARFDSFLPTCAVVRAGLVVLGLGASPLRVGG